ncbi:cytochrome P450 [Boletus edulis]|nr:cytochrome P450 [Boletus edulis]
MGVRVLDVSLAGLALYLVVRLVCRSASLPPGPPGLPLIGNLRIIRAEAPHKTLGAMTSKYGKYHSSRSLGTHYVFLNSTKAAKDICEQRSAITSNRPHLVLSHELIGWGSATPFLPYGDMHRKHRKLFVRYLLANSNLVTFYPSEEAEARRFIFSVLMNPDDLVAHCYRSTEAFILKISHGYSVKDGNDPLVEMSKRAIRNISETMAPGRFLVDFFPILRYLPEWFPGGSFHEDVKRGQKLISEAVNGPYEFVLKNLAKGDAAPSLISQLLREGVIGEDKEILKWVSFGMYLAHQLQTPSMLSAFFLAMTMYPEVFKKAQAEVDTVVGNERLPTMEDRDGYVNAICTELLRWNVGIPLPAHVSTEDMIYEGYLIPKGSWLMPNVWYILSNPETYPFPETFDPERFLGENQQPDPQEVCFGLGRRRCLGARLAESMIFIYIAMSLATLDVSRYVEDGVEWVPRYDIDEGMLRRVKPFKCKIAPRSSKVEDLRTRFDST